MAHCVIVLMIIMKLLLDSLNVATIHAIYVLVIRVVNVLLLTTERKALMEIIAIVK